MFVFLKKSICDHQFIAEEKKMVKKRIYLITTSSALYLFAEIQLPQFWLRDPAVPQIHSLIKFSQHPIRKKKMKHVSYFTMRKTRDD